MDIAKEAGDSWIRLDPVALRREAELKEAKHKRKQEQREIRTDARRERRHQKAEAKRARKANVKPAAKWNAERKAADKLKKIANRPAKQEKRHRRLGLRAEKLEAQAKKLMAEAQKARARFEYLNELKAKEEQAETEAARVEKEKERKLVESGDFVPLEDDPDEEADMAEKDLFPERDEPPVNGDAKSRTATSHERSQRMEPTDEDVDLFAESPHNPELTAMQRPKPWDKSLNSQSMVSGEADDVSKSTKDKKKRKKTTRPSAEPSSEAAHVDDLETTTRKNKKHKTRNFTEEAATPSGIDVALSPEVTSLAAQDQLSVSPEAVDGTVMPVEKRKKERKRKREAEINGETVENNTSPAKEVEKDKEKKKSKKPRGEKLHKKYAENPGPNVQQPGTDLSEQWNVRGLGGGTARQDKFLRLLGGKKGSVSSSFEGTDRSPAKTTARGRLDMAHVNEDLEKQFEAGMRMKDLHGPRRGLGA